MSKHHYFLDTIRQLREEEQLVLYEKSFKTHTEEAELVSVYLERCYEEERMEYSFAVPDYSPAAALWAAKTVYYAAQLYLFRKDTEKEIDSLFPGYTQTVDTGAVLSADLCLRFLPKLIVELQAIDAADPLVARLMEVVQPFIYSNIGNPGMDIPDMDWEAHCIDPCYRHLFLNRIIARQSMDWGGIPYFYHLLISHFGMYKDQFWKTLTLHKPVPENGTDPSI